MDVLNEFAGKLGVDAITLGLWLLAGFIIGLIGVGGRRPLELVGDLIVGLIGGVGAGYAFARFGSAVPVDLADYPKKLAPSLSDATADSIVAFVVAFVGALLLLIVLRLLPLRR